MKVTHYDARGGEPPAPLPSEERAEEKQLGVQLRAWGGGGTPKMPGYILQAVAGGLEALNK